jgi:hypothetical protein
MKKANISRKPAAKAAGSGLADPPLVHQIGSRQYPSRDEIRKTYEDFLFARAIQAYMMTIPVLNTIGMRDGSEGTFGRGYNVLPIWKDRMNAKTWVPTPNCDVIYSMNYLDLKETGPLVVNAPPNVIGMFTDFMQRTLTDVGAAGPDLARGGLYLLLPPDYDGPIPGGYYTFRSRTYNVFLFFRTVLAKGPNGPDVTKAVETAEMTRVYPLGMPERVRPAMKFPNAAPVRVNMMYPTDFTYWENLKNFVDYEPVGVLDLDVRGMLASLGIIKDQPFKPDSRLRDILSKAVVEAPKQIFAMRLTASAFPNNPYYTDRHYISVWGGVDADWNTPTYQNIDTRAAYFQVAYSSAPAMVNDTVGQGSKYPNTMYDADGDFLDGGKHYKLHLPPNIPAALYWAVTALQPNRRNYAGNLTAIPLTQRVRSRQGQLRQLRRSLLRSDEACTGTGRKLDPDSSQSRPSHRRPSLRRWSRFLRSDMEARRSRQDLTGGSNTPRQPRLSDS